MAKGIKIVLSGKEAEKYQNAIDLLDILVESSSFHLFCQAALDEEIKSKDMREIKKMLDGFSVISKKENPSERKPNRIGKGIRILPNKHNQTQPCKNYTTK